MRIKRKLNIVLFIILSVPLWGQSRLESEEFYVGFHGGMIFSTVSFYPHIDGVSAFKDCLKGWNGGLVFRYSGHRCCGLQLEANYKQRGWREYIVEQNVDYSRLLHYVEMPFLSHIYFGSQAVRGFINVGPQIGYCISNEETGVRQVQYTAQYEKIKNPFYWGAIAGAGLYLRSKKAGVFQLEWRFDYSFGHLFGVRGGNYFNRATPLNMSVNVAYLWEFKRKR